MEVETAVISGLTMTEEEEMDPWMSMNWAEAAWPPVWEAIERSPQYACGMIYRFVERWPLEDEFDRPDSEFDVPPPAFWEEFDPPDLDYHHTIKTFLKQVRESRGYDLDVNAPSPFSVMTHFLDCTDSIAMWLKQELSPIMKFAVAQINTNAQPHGKCYHLLKVEKLVDAGPHRTKLITFTVKEVAPGPEQRGDDHSSNGVHW